MTEHSYAPGWVRATSGIGPWRYVSDVRDAWRFCPACGSALSTDSTHAPRCTGCARSVDVCVCACNAEHGAADYGALRKRAATWPLGVDVSDFGDEWVAGFLAGQANLVDWLASDAPEIEEERALIGRPR